jgi:hypothetical protein
MNCQMTRASPVIASSYRVDVADDALLWGPCWCCCLDFNGGGDNLEFALLRGGDTEMGEDLLVRLDAGDCYGAGWLRANWAIRRCRGCRVGRGWQFLGRPGVGVACISS